MITSRYESQADKIQSTDKAMIEKDRMRVDVSTPGNNHLMIYRADLGKMWIIDPEKKQYQELSKQEITGMMQKMQEATKRLEAQMASMPQAQREAMKKMMPQMPKPSVVTYQKKADGIKIGNYTCTLYEGFVDQKKVSEMWTTDLKALSMSPEDFAVMNSFGEMFEAISKDFTSPYKISSLGLPIRMAQYNPDGSQKHLTEVVSIERQNTDPALFELPKDFVKQSRDDFDE